MTGRLTRVCLRKVTAAVARAGLAAGLAVAGFATASPAGAATRLRLSNDVLPALSSYRDLGALSASRRVEVDMTLSRPHPAAEAALLAAQYTKGSKDYHDFLTPAEFDKRFGVAPASFAATRRFATAHGMTVVNATDSRDLLVLSGTAAQVERTFGVSLHSFRSGTRTFYANTDAPTVPAGLGISGVVGLTDKLGMHLFRNSAKHAVKPAQDTCAAGSCLGLTTPQDLWATYEQPGGYSTDPNGNKTVDFGQNQSMAVFGEGQTDPVIANLRTFEKVHKLPTVPVKVVHVDGKKADYSDNAGEIEWDLDTQASTGMSPDVLGETLYFGKDLSDQSVLNAFSTWADDPNGPNQANASYGECEENAAGDLINSGGSTTGPAQFSSSAMFTTGSEAALSKANAEGRTLFSSAGDTGSSCPVVPAATLNGVTNEVVPIPNYPASSPHAVDVGGTVLYTNSTTHKRALEYTWTYSGGGTSFLFAKPSWQDGITAIAGVCDYSPGGGTANVGKPCRGAPDVAAQSGDVLTNGYGIVADGQTNYPGGGTSLSSPLWMGMWTRIQATAPKCGCGKYKGDGFASPVLYKQFKAKGSQVFFDIGGVTDSLPAPNGAYVSTPGWDYTSGMGTPRVANLALAINGTTKPVLPCGCH